MNEVQLTPSVIPRLLEMVSWSQYHPGAAVTAYVDERRKQLKVEYHDQFGARLEVMHDVPTLTRMGFEMRCGDGVPRWTLDTAPLYYPMPKPEPQTIFTAPMDCSSITAGAPKAGKTMMPFTERVEGYFNGFMDVAGAPGIHDMATMREAVDADKAAKGLDRMMDALGWDPTALGWLDRQVEEICRLGRLE